MVCAEYQLHFCIKMPTRTKIDVARSILNIFSEFRILREAENAYYSFPIRKRWNCSGIVVELWHVYLEFSTLHLSTTIRTRSVRLAGSLLFKRGTRKFPSDNGTFHVL